MDTRVPHFDGQKDYMAFVRFLDNRKEFEGYCKQLDTKVAAFNKAVAVYGKAKEIEALHHDAELLAHRAQSAFGEREGKLKAGEAALAKELKEKRAALRLREQKVEENHRNDTQELRATEAALKAREGEVGKRENAILARENRAQEAQEEAQRAKQEAHALVARLKAATAA